MYSSEDLERFYFQYQTEALPHGESLQSFCVKNKVPYNIFQKWFKDTRKKVVEVQVDGAPEITHEEKTKIGDVLNGTIYGGNTGQLKKVDNPYNPINLLMIGRTDAIIPFIAFGDKPITGWGYNTSDPHLYYRTLMMRMASDDEKKQLRLGIGHYYTIPGHSVWGYYACSYGVIAFILILLLIAKVWRCVYISLRRKDKYLLYRSYLIFMFTWNILFSPMAHFKTLPMYVAIMLVLSTISYYGKSISIKKSILNMKKEGNKWYTIRRMND